MARSFKKNNFPGNTTSESEKHNIDRDILNKAATKLELLAQAIRDENKELFDDLTYDADAAYCQGVGIVANVDLDEVHSIIFRSMYNGNWNSNHQEENYRGRRKSERNALASYSSVIYDPLEEFEDLEFEDEFKEAVLNTL